MRGAGLRCAPHACPSRGAAEPVRTAPSPLPAAAVRREICPHGQGSPERLTLLIPADWAAQLGVTGRRAGPFAPGTVLPPVVQGPDGSLDSSPFSAFSPVRGPASASPTELAALQPAAEAV